MTLDTWVTVQRLCKTRLEPNKVKKALKCGVKSGGPKSPTTLASRIVGVITTTTSAHGVTRNAGLAHNLSKRPVEVLNEQGTARLAFIEVIVGAVGTPLAKRLVLAITPSTRATRFATPFAAA